MKHGLKPVGERRTDALAQLDWRELETLLAAYYEGQGYRVEHCGTGGTGARFDGGVDLRLRRGDEIVLVQVKHWNACKVPHNDVHQLLGLMVNEGATGAVLVTSREFTRAAVEAAARQGHVQLVDGDALRRMLGPAIGRPEPSAGDRAAQLAAAAAPRPPPRPRPDARSARRAERRATLVWLAIAVGGALLFLVLIRGVFEKTRWTAGPSRAPVAQGVDDASAPAIADGSRVLVTPGPADGSCIDGAGADCVAGVRHRPMPEAERRAEQRRAEEAMKVIEASTPEM